MGDKAIRGNRLTKGPHGHGYKPQLSTHAKGGRAGYFGGGRTNLLEELGRVEAEPSNRNRRAEISRVHGELNRGYAAGGIAKIVGKKAVDWIKKNRRAITKELHSPEGKAKTQELTEKLKKGMGRPGHAEGGRAGFVLGSSVRKVAKVVKEYKKKKKLAEDTKKGKFPETESLTHQKGPYVGDVGSEKSGLKRREWEKPDWPKRPGPKRPEWKRMPAAKGGKADKNWIQKAVNPKHKGYCTPMTKKTCTPARKALARTFKKKAKTGW